MIIIWHIAKIWMCGGNIGKGHTATHLKEGRSLGKPAILSRIPSELNQKRVGLHATLKRDLTVGYILWKQEIVHRPPKKAIFI